MTPAHARLAVGAALLILPVTLMAKTAGAGDVRLAQGTDRLPGGVERMPTAPPSMQVPRAAMPPPMPMPAPVPAPGPAMPAAAAPPPPPPADAAKPAAVDPAVKRAPDKP